MASAKWTSTTKANGNVADNGSQTIIIQFKPPLPLSLNEDDIIDYLTDKGFGDFVTSDSVQFVEEDTHVTFNNASIVPNVIRNIKGTLLQGQYKVTVVYLMSDGPPSPAKPKSYSQAVSRHAAPKAGQGSGHPTAPSQSKKATPVSVTQRHPPVPKPAASQQQPPVPRPAAPQQQPPVPRPAAPQQKPPVPRPAAPQQQPPVPRPAVPQQQPPVPRPTAPQQQPPVPRPAAPQHQPPVPRPVALQRQPIQSFPGVPATAKLVTSLPDPPSGRLEQRPQGSTFTQRDTSSVAASQPDVVTTRSAQRTAGQSQGGVASRGAKGAGSNSSQTRIPSQSQAQAQSQSQAPNQSQAQSQPQAHSQSQAPNQSQAQSQSQAQAPNQSQPQAQSQSLAQAPIQSQPQGSSLPTTQQRGKPPPFQEPPHLLADQSSPPPPSSGGCTLIIRGLRSTLRDGELRNEIVKLDVVLDQCKLSLREDGTKEAILKVSQEADARHIRDELPESTDLGEKITITIIP